MEKKLPGSETEEANANPRPARLLIVDDTPEIHDDFRRILCPPQEDARLDAQAALVFGNIGEIPHRAPPERYRIDSAYQGREALDLAKRAIDAEDPYMLMFVDMRMPPGWDGLSTNPSGDLYCAYRS